MDRLKDKVAIVTGAGTREVEDRELRRILDHCEIALITINIGTG